MESKYTFDRIIRWVIIGLIIIAVYIGVRSLSSVLLPFFIAWFFAYLLYPVVKFVQYKLKVRIRAIAIIITMLATLAVVAAVVWLIIPPMIEQIGTLQEFLSAYVAKTTDSGSITEYIRNFIEQNEQEITRFLHSDDFSQAVKEAVPQLFAVVGQTASVLMSIAASAIVLMYMFFILLDYEYLSHNWTKIFPAKARPFWREVMSDVEAALNSYIRGQGLVALCMGIMFCIGFTIIDFPMAIGLGILIGIMDLVPYLHTFALIPTAFLALLKAANTGQNFWVIFAMAVAIFIIVQLITDFITTPRIMGKAMGLNPAVLLLALSVWGSLLGFIGLILALPLTTLIFAYWRRYVTKEEGATTPTTNNEISNS